MIAGYSGTYVISLLQTEVDGLEGAPLTAVTVGAAWAWRGDAVRVDGPNNVLQLENAKGAEHLRRRAASMVQRLVGQALDRQLPVPKTHFDPSEPLMDRSFVVTDGASSYTVTLIETGATSGPLLMFHGQLPPRNTELWVVEHSIKAKSSDLSQEDKDGVICFTHGTQILTPHGPVPIETLRAGDYIQTKDNGAQQIQWIGARRMTGARLFAAPKLRPIRIRAGAFGAEHPQDELLVSPEHRMLIRGPVAQDLFNTPEVLVTARDLINGRTIAVDTTVRELTYVHLMLGQHEVLWANGLETESFHPANAALSSLSDRDRCSLLEMHPALEYDPYTFGAYARRNLSQSEAAILRHAA